MNGAYLAVLISLGIILVWGALAWRILVALIDHREHRLSALIMPGVGLLAGIGTLASAVGYLAALSPDIEIPPEPLTLLASMGRGALLMGGIFAFVLPPLPKKKKAPKVEAPPP